MFQSPQNNIVVTVDTKYIGHYSNIIKTANLNPGSQLNPADLVNIVGTIVSVPKSITNTQYGYKGFSLKDIEVGDKCLFRYDVIFDFTEVEFSDVPLYKNMVMYRGEEYFLVDIQKLFAVFKNESIKMLNGYTMIEDIEEESKIYLPQSQKRISRAKEATLSQIGNPLEGEKRLDVFPGDRVLVHPNRIQHYQIKSKKFGIVKDRDIFGRVLN